VPDNQLVSIEIFSYDSTPARSDAWALYQNGQGVQQDMAQARAWMQKAAVAGDEDAKKWLARN
jgi:TPR repeat protein